MSTSKNLLFAELERQLQKSARQKDDRRVCDLCVELGDEYRRIGDLHDALSYYRKSVELAEKLKICENAVFAHRAIAEILVDPSIQENTKALEHGKKYLEAANKSGNVHFIQLAYHVLGWLHLQIYLNSSAKQELLLKKAKQWCERSLTYLSKHALDIDCDKDAVQMGQDSRSRKARLQQVLSQICDKMKLQSLSLCYHNAAMAYAARAGDHDLQYRCLLSKMNFSGDQRLKTAIELVHVATNLNQQASWEAKLILAQEKIRAKDFVGAKWDLISMLASKGHEKLDAEDQRSFYQLLVTVYKTIERLRMLSTADEHFKMKINEKIADSLYENSVVQAGFCEISLEFYKQMLTYAHQTEDKIKALISVAETAKELDRYEEAFNCFVEVESLENTLNICDAKKADTSLCIANTAASTGSFTVKEVLEFFRKSECLTIYNHQKKTLYENMLAYMDENDVDKNLRIEIEAKLESLGNDAEGDDDGKSKNDDGKEDFIDKWDELSDTQILARCNEEANRHSMKERIRSEKDKKINLYGETRMHEAARGNDTQYLKMLIEMGYNVNARDEGGWTPLHEAVGALKFENVRILVKFGANLNLRSNEGTLSADGERTDSGGLTPLMEACDRGATAIVDLLLKFGANVAIKNCDDWTALDFFRNAIKMGMVEDDVMEEAKQLASIMEMKLKEVNITVNAEPPPKKLKLNDKTKLKMHSNVASEKILDPNVSNLHEYRETMNVVGRGTTHDRINALLDGLDIDDTSFYEGEMDEACHTRHLSPTLDDALIGIDDLIEFPSSHQASSSFSSSSLPTLIKKQRTAGAENAEKITQMKQNLSTDFCDDSNFDSAVLSEPTPESRQSKSSQLYEKDTEEDSDDDIVMISRPAIRRTQNGSSSNTELQSSKRSGRGNLAVVSSSRECRISSLLSSSNPSNVKNQFFIKIMIKKDDGTHLKTKGMPFASSCVIGDIRKRCEEELKGDVEYKSMTICHDNCELSDDTPIELVLTDEKILECIISGCAKPTAAQIYTKRARKLMANILHALSESTNGSLDLREMNISQDDAVYAAVEVLQSNLLELYLDGNSLSTSFIDLISKVLRHLTLLNLSCCALKSIYLRQLIGDYSVCDALSKLDLSYNNLSDNGSDYLVTFIGLCPNLTDLKLACCNISQSVANGLIQQIKKIILLEVLDLSFNSEVNSDYASEIIQACRNLKYLDLSCTAVSRIDNVPEMEGKLETLKLSLNDLHDPDHIIQWSLSYCPNMLLLDLSATTATCSIIEICLKIKVDKMPFTTILLADCNCLEANPEEIVDVLKATLITSSTVRFQFSNKFRQKIEESLPDSYKFCLK
uniref:Tonsoku-like protein n=1 Tax=Onchocerca volvulus TaxID=6282 RepID=A0A8R1XMK9_ONCVO